MATKTEIKYTKFANEYMANGNNARLAYKSIYPNVKDNTADVNGSKLLKNTKVIEIIAKVQKKVENKALVTLEEVVGSLKRIAKTAEEGDQLAVAKGCWQDLGKVVGAFVDKTELTGANGQAIKTVTKIEILPVKGKGDNNE